MVANRSTFKEDLYLVYEGLNQDTVGLFSSYISIRW